MREKIITILNKIKKGIDYETATNLIDSRILDSLSIIALVSELSCEFDVVIDVMDLEPNNLNSVNAIVNLIEDLTA